MRPSWDEVWMATAHAVAGRSLCVRAKVGCVIVTADNRVESATYNGPSPSFEHHDLPCDHWCPRARREAAGLDPAYDDCISSHAEANGLTRSDVRELDGATLFVTSVPCYGCAKLIVQTGIGRVVYTAEAGREYRQPVRTLELLEANGVIIAGDYLRPRIVDPAREGL